MYFWYHPEIDRFSVTIKRIRPLIDDVYHSVYFSGLEYHRYIPLEDITLEMVNRRLATEPREICFEINQACNLMCPICIAGAGPHSDRHLSLSQFEETLDKFHTKISRITLTGGEPILHREFSDFAQIAASKVEGVVIATNGYQPERLHEVLKGLEKLTITVSLQGSRDVHDKFVGQNGAFEKSIETILLCLEQGHCVHVLTTAFTEAISSLPFLAGYLKNIPVSEHRINLVKFRGRVEREASSWEEVEKAISFVQPNYKLTVKRNGQPFIFIGSDGKEEKRYE